MHHRRDIRRLAMQLLYQIDLRGEADLQAIHEGLADGPDNPQIHQQAMDLAQSAWATRSQADTLISELTPAWPTQRQPPVDRAILRLAFYEIQSAYSPHKVAINEAIELAKHFGTEQSPAFVNGVLDKLAKRLANPPQPTTIQTETHPATLASPADHLSNQNSELSSESQTPSPQ